MSTEKSKEPENKITAELKLLIRDTVDERLKDLPATTYQTIEKMVADKVAAVEKHYQKMGLVVIAALTVSAGVFYKVTAENASAKASEAIAKAALGQKLKEVEEAHAQIQNTKNLVATAGADALQSATKITTKLQELEKQDNIVRYSYNGNLVLPLQDGELRIRRKNPDKEISLYIDKNGHLQITDGTNTFDPLAGRYLTVP